MTPDPLLDKFANDGLEHMTVVEESAEDVVDITADLEADNVDLEKLWNNVSKDE